MLCFLGFVSFVIFLNGNIILYSETQYSSHCDAKQETLA
jgi:hypothetical protein